MWEHCQKIIEKINDFFKKHWFWYTLIIAIPTAWFSAIVPYWGNVLKLQNDEGMTLFGTIISLCLIVPIAILVFCNSWYSGKAEQKKTSDLEGEIGFLRTINENVDKICDEKYDQLRRTIAAVYRGDEEIPRIVTRPSNQLKRIIAGITSSLVNCIGSEKEEFTFKDFLVSIAYNFPLENSDWEWVDGMKEGTLTLEELLAPGCHSTFKFLIDTQQPYYYNNSKEDAKREHRYHYNKQDELNEENGEPVGSIFCYNFKIKQGKNTFVNAFLSISTTKKRFSVEKILI